VVVVLAVAVLLAIAAAALVLALALVLAIPVAATPLPFSLPLPLPPPLPLTDPNPDKISAPKPAELILDSKLPAAPVFVWDPTTTTLGPRERGTPSTEAAGPPGARIRM